MSKAEIWLHMVARALWERVKVVYEGLQGPSDGRSGVPEGDPLTPPFPRLLRADCNRDTQEGPA